MTLAFAVGCGGGDDAREKGEAGFERVFVAIKGLDGKERERKLLEMARAEGGEVSIYTSLTAESETIVTDAFSDAYEDVDLSVYRATSEAVAQRVSEESKAGFRGADAIETNGTEMAALAEQGVFEPFEPEGSNELLKGSLRDGWTATRYNKFVISWNTDLVKDGEQPRDWADLADPRFRGQIALEQSDGDWYKSLREHFIAEGRTEAEADRLFERIAANARILDSHALMGELLGAGEFSVAASNYLHAVRNSIDKGAPVEFMPFVEPIFSRPQGIGLLKTARNPATAVLYLEWVTGEGQEALKEGNVDPARRDLASSAGAREVVVDVEEFVAEAKVWDDRYERLLRLGRKVQSEE